MQATDLSVAPSSGAAAEPPGAGMSLRTKGLITFAVMALYIAFVAVLINQERLKLVGLVAQLESVHRNEEQLIQINMSVARAILTVNEAFVSENPNAVAPNVMIELEAVSAALGTLQGQHPRLVILQHSLEALSADMARQGGRGVLAVTRNNLHELVTELDEITLSSRQQKLKLLDDYKGVHDKVVQEAMALSLLGMVLLGTFGALFFTRMTADIRRLELRAREVVRGYRGEPLEVSRGDEIGGLMQAVNAMQSDLRSHEMQIEVARQQQFHREKMAAVGSLAAAVAHEINNPIQAIAGIAQSIRDIREVRHCPNHGQVCQPDLILEQARRVSVITRQIADFSVPRPQEPALTDINGLVRSVCALVAYDKRLRGVEIDTALDPELPAVRAVGDHITQVLMNLIINAADALAEVADRPRQIRIVTTPKQGGVSIEVADTGAGMDEQTRARAFEEFYTTKPAGKGSGLGLALCKQMVESAGGTITLDSQPGVGTQVRIELPLRATTRAAA